MRRVPPRLPDPVPPANRVFVFGTLKQGFPNAHVNRGRRVPGEFVTDACYPLYLVGERAVPWMLDLPGQGHRVAGELYEVDDDALARMDRLERVGEPDGYHRALIGVRPREHPRAAVLSVHAYLKSPERFDPARVRHGPLAEYTPAFAALYRAR